jgi:hypothetical protein
MRARIKCASGDEFIRSSMNYSCCCCVFRIVATKTKLIPLTNYADNNMSDRLPHVKVFPECYTHMEVFENMEGKDPDDIYDYMLCPPNVYPLPPPGPDVKPTSVCVRCNLRRPYMCAHEFFYDGPTPHHETFVITDSTRKKKGRFPRTTARKLCVKELRNNRTFVVYDIEWMESSPEVKKEPNDE